MPVSRMQTHQMVHEAATTLTRRTARTAVKQHIDDVMTELNAPLRLRAESPNSSKLVIEAAQQTMPDSGLKVAGILDDAVGSLAQTTIDLQSGATTGGTVLRDGAAFSLPSGSTTGYFRIMAVVYKPAIDSIDTSFSAEAATVGALVNPGVVFASLDGINLGYLILEATASSAYKTEAAATSVVENAKIYRFGGSSGAGGGVDKTYRPSALSATGFTLKGGYAAIDDKRVLASGSGTTKASVTDLVINGDTLLSEAGLGANVAAASKPVRLTLAIDLWTLSSAVTITDNLREVYRWGQSNLVLLTGLPEEIDPRRYYFLNEFHIPTGATTWADAEIIYAPQRVHDSLTSFVAPAQVASLTHTGVAATQNHGLAGKPDVIEVNYFDGTNEYPVEDMSHVVWVTSTQIRIEPAGLDTTGGKEFRIKLIYFPTQTLLAIPMNGKTFGPYTSAGATTVAHGLTDPSYRTRFMVIEHDTSTDRFRERDPSSIVKEWDATNVYLDWTGISFTNLEYYIVAGPGPSAAGLPIEYGGYTKFVGGGPGSYLTVTAALAVAVAGDRILIRQNTSESAALSVPAGVELDQMPNTTVTLSATAFASGAIRLTGAKAAWRHMNAKVTGITGTLAKAVSIEAADCKIDGDLEIDCAGQTVTDAVEIAAGGLRARVEVGVKFTAGVAITNLLDNQDGAGNVSVWGG